jgi:UDP-N-acetylglucosamine 4-epimerase
MLVAARDAGVARFVYAASSSTYGDHPALPKVEDVIGRPLSPYAVTKYVDELYADVFGRCYGTAAIGLRYFNVFGARQDPEGAYAAVIPRWVDAMLRGSPVVIHGDGETTRDFCYVANVVQANLLASTTVDAAAVNQVYNVAVGGRMSLNALYDTLRSLLSERHPGLTVPPPLHEDFRPGDVRHSQADIAKARRPWATSPTTTFAPDLIEALPWYEARFAAPTAPALAGVIECARRRLTAVASRRRVVDRRSQPARSPPRQLRRKFRRVFRTPRRALLRRLWPTSTVKVFPRIR